MLPVLHCHITCCLAGRSHSEAEAVLCTRLGAIDARPTYHKVMQLWPVGYEAESAGHSGCTLRSSIADGGAEGPLFTVALVPSDAGQETAVRPAFVQSVHCRFEKLWGCKRMCIHLLLSNAQRLLNVTLICKAAN
jgi:hypothetical protein